MKQYIKILTLPIGTVLFGYNLSSFVCQEALQRIDSLPQLKEYDFIAHVKIVDDQDFKKPSKDNKPYRQYQTYDKNGFPDTGWDYDENGKVIKK